MPNRYQIGQNNPLLLNEDYLYQFNESIYIITHHEELLQACADSLYETVKGENPPPYLVAHYDLAKFIIGKYISVSNGCFIVHSPRSGEPSIVIYAGDFIPSDLSGKEENSPTIGELYNKIPLKQQIKGGKYITKAGGEYMSNRGKELQRMAERMNSRAGRREVTRRIYNPTQKSKALENLTKSYQKTIKQSARYAYAGGILLRLGKFLGSRRVPIFLDSMKPWYFAEATTVGREKAMVESFVESKLSDICITYNNYYMIMNQTYITQGR